MAYIVKLYSITEEGQKIFDKIARMKDQFFRCEKLVFISSDNLSLNEELFKSCDAHVFIGAAGIAVRKTAPFISSKTTDPAVIVIDEKGKNVIPVLSGHIGGGNSLSKIIAHYIGGEAVITTATDVNGYISIDDIAADYRLLVQNKNAIKAINSKILKGKKIYVYSDEFCDLHMRDDGVYEIGEKESADVIIYSDATVTEDSCIKNDETCSDLFRTENRLILFNRRIVLGIGCRKNTDSELFEQTVLKHLSDNGINILCIDRIASIDIKREEEAILTFSKKYGIMFETYNSKELSSVDGEFDESDFVKETTGVSNVSERAAAFASELMGEYSFISKRICENGITISIAEVRKRIEINGKA